jgi:DNA-binding NarL/FixJ family response regulator
MAPAAVIRVIVVEDDQKIRESLAALLEGSPGFACAGKFATAESALSVIKQKTPDLILVDLELPGMSGTEFLRTCRLRFPRIELLVLTMHSEASWIFPALEAGASGYIVKGTSPANLLDAITEVHSGGSFMSSQVARLVMKSFQKPASGAADGSLSPRENEVLRLLSKGMRYAEIAAELGISPRTVNTHLHRIYEKLHVHSAAGAVGKVMRNKQP